MHKIIYPALSIAMLSGCGSTDSPSTLKARRDAATITITPDGLYDVMCKNGERQLVTEAEFLADKVCELNPQQV